ALGLEVVEDLEDFTRLVDRRRWTVQLQQVERVGVEVAKASLDERGQMLAIVPFGHMRAQSPPGFRGHNDRLLPLAPEPGDEPLRVPVPVDVRRIEKVDAKVRGAM